MITLNRPFNGTNQLEIFTNILKTEPKPPSHAHTDLEILLKKLILEYFLIICFIDI